MVFAVFFRQFKQNNIDLQGLTLRGLTCLNWHCFKVKHKSADAKSDLWWTVLFFLLNFIETTLPRGFDSQSLTYPTSEVVRDESHLSDVKNVCESHILTITWMSRLIEGWTKGLTDHVCYVVWEKFRTFWTTSDIWLLCSFWTLSSTLTRSLWVPVDSLNEKTPHCGYSPFFSLIWCGGYLQRNELLLRRGTNHLHGGAPFFSPRVKPHGHLVI